MKKINFLLGIAVVAIGIVATSCDSKKVPNIKNDVDSVSYALGILNGEGFKQSLAGIPGEPVNAEILLAAFAQSYSGDTAGYKMTTEEAQAFIQEYLTSVQLRESQSSKEEGTKFLEENKTKSGVITTESGLQYKVEKEGTGEKPTVTDQVKVHYTGTLLDGTKFDSSVDRGEPATFGVSQVIKGWTEGLQIMPVGSKYIFWIPSELAYGEQGARTIKPNSVLKFEVELLEIVK